MPDADDPWIRITLEIPDVAPADVVEAFTDPAAVQAWWGGAQLTIDPEVGGQYVAFFDRLGQTMRGEITEIEPGRGRFRFTWSWEHTLELPARLVQVSVDDGAVLHLDQGIYDHASRLDRDDARSHREGWEFFLPRLAELVRARR